MVCLSWKLHQKNSEKVNTKTHKRSTMTTTKNTSERDNNSVPSTSSKIYGRRKEFSCHKVCRIRLYCPFLDSVCLCSLLALFHTVFFRRSSLVSFCNKTVCVSVHGLSFMGAVWFISCCLSAHDTMINFTIRLCISLSLHFAFSCCFIQLCLSFSGSVSFYFTQTIIVCI